MTKRNRFILQLRETFPIQIVSTYTRIHLDEFRSFLAFEIVAGVYLYSTRKIEKLKRKRNPMLVDANF